MGYYATYEKSCPVKPDLLSKNCVWDFSASSLFCTRQNPSKPLETTSETSVTITTTVSGLPFWPSRDPLSDLVALEVHTRGKNREEIKLLIEKSVDPLYLSMNNDSINQIDALGLVTTKSLSGKWDKCYKAYTKTLTKAEKTALEDCLIDCVGKGSWGATGACLAKCATGKSAAFAARIACCSLGVGSKTFENPCADDVKNPAKETCQECCEQTICANIVMLAVDVTQIAVDMRLKKCYCGCN